MSLIAGNLGVVQRLLDAHAISWGVCAGAASHLYGDRRPIKDIDILVIKGGLTTIVQLLQQERKAVQYDGNRVFWRGIKLFDDLSIRRAHKLHPFTLDSPMEQHLRRMPLLGSRVAVLAPEDVFVHKILLGRGPEQGKHDLTDAASIARRQRLDLAYLQERMRLMHVQDLLASNLATYNITFSSATEAPG